MSRKRYVIEGEWDGYSSSQRRVVHREVLTGSPKYIEKFKALKTFRYTDGTHLSITVREAKPREKVQEILGYKTMIHDAVAWGYSGFITIPFSKERQP